MPGSENSCASSWSSYGACSPVQPRSIRLLNGRLYNGLKKAGHPKGARLDHSGLVTLLARGRPLASKRYYIGSLRNHDNSEKSAQLLASQQKFLGGLENEGFTVKRGRIVYDHKIREKGVDVKIAVDLIVGAVDDLYDIAIIVSSDTDLIPAIQYVQFKGKKVEYVGFSQHPSLGMAKHGNLSVLLLPEDLQKLTSVGA
ncbi:NYN domain-containing protein [Bradyrhizobium sp. CIAT3101]|uniref:NYN domain-containing protein n=1 Tax=Bradyrhizobium sp. CIAT3101 TaxID=439387 RepID=UPI0024B0B4BD|nr:NYN domain-containing protein [Bradyrhizobium sp. CIAT3101]WFU79184.1 NYN domain-containing protein [Bradyrhizobium sp. CIAT3101]